MNSFFINAVPSEVCTIHIDLLNEFTSKFHLRHTKFVDYIEYMCYEYPTLNKNKKKWISICDSNCKINLLLSWSEGAGKNRQKPKKQD